MVAGDFSGCREPEATRADSPTADEVLVERLGRLPIPVALGGAFGHGTRNRALPYGTMCELDTLAGTLTALEGAVSYRVERAQLCCAELIAECGPSGPVADQPPDGIGGIGIGSGSSMRPKRSS